MNGEIFHLGPDFDEAVRYRMSVLLEVAPVAITVFDKDQVSYEYPTEIDVDCVLFVNCADTAVLPRTDLLSALHVVERGHVLAIHGATSEDVEAAWGEILAAGDGLH